MKRKAIDICLALITIAIQPALVSAQASTIPPILITEVQAGTTISASQEFIELFNQSDKPIDVSSWQVQIASSTATDWTKAKKITLKGTFYPGTYYLLASSYVATGDAKSYLQDYANVQFVPGLTATSGHVRLVTTGTQTAVVDALEWSTKKADASLTSPAIEAWLPATLDASLAAGDSIKRRIDADGHFAYARTASDFVVSSCPSPTMTNDLDHATDIDETTTLPLATTIDIQNQRCAEDAEGSADGEATQPGEEPAAILLPAENKPDAQSKGEAVIPEADRGLASPRITEVLPNPATPQLDNEDEFIELYNSNDAAFDLSGFILVSGTSKRYVFPAGESIGARSFKAFFSADTHLSLSNTAGSVRLLDPTGVMLDKTDDYVAAKDGQAWVLANGVWQWTILPTPHATNAVQLPATKIAKASKATATKQTTAKTQSAAAKKPKKQAVDSVQTAATVIPDSPVHPSVLAGVGALALLYGAYEYRRDVANKFYQFRVNRAARRAHRQGIKRR